jgi:hypothetical protein
MNIQPCFPASAFNQSENREKKPGDFPWNLQIRHRIAPSLMAKFWGRLISAHAGISCLIFPPLPGSRFLQLSPPVNRGSKAAGPTLYKPETVGELLAALRAGITHKQACLACGIGQRTLAGWRRKHRELGPQMEAAREIARQKALEGIKKAGEKGWRALAEWLKLTFPEYRQNSSINVSAGAVNDNRTVVITEQKRAGLQAKLKAIQDASDSEKQSPSPSSLQTQQRASTRHRRCSFRRSSRCAGSPLAKPQSVRIRPCSA